MSIIILIIWVFIKTLIILQNIDKICVIVVKMFQVSKAR